MANSLMFEVGVSENVKNLNKVKDQLNSLIENFSKTKAIQLRVEIDNLDAINTALSKIGNSPKLRELRQEIESLNREFSKLAAGAGGVGDLNLRAANQNVAELKENWQSANRTLLRYKTDLEDLRRTRDMQPVGSQARTDYQGQIATFKKTVEEQQKIADAAKSAYDKAVKDAGQLVDANTRAEASYRELKSSIDGLKTSSNGNIVGTDFANWAKEVQNVTASIRELVEQLQKMNNAAKASANVSNEALLAQAKTVDDLRTKYNKMLHDGLTIPKSAASYTAIENLPNVEKQLTAEQTRFNEMLIRGASVAGSFAEAIQQLGQKYSFTAEQAQKLAAIIASGDVSRGNIQRRLGVGYEKAGDIVETINALQKLKQEESKPAPQGGLFDTQKFNTLQEAIDKIISEINRLQQAFTRLGENSSLSNLSTMINGLAVTLSTLSNAIKIQPLDEQVKALLERCEKAEAKLREVGDAAKYLNERAGAKTQQKASSIMGITGTDEEQLNKVSSTAERFMRLLVEIENQMAKIGKIQALGEQSGFSPTLLKNAQTQLDALKKMVESTFKGTPIADGLVIPASNSQLAQFIQQFGLLKAQYRDIITEADRFNKATEKGSSQAESRIRKLGMAFNELKNYMKANGGSEEMKRLQQEIQGAIQKMRQLMNAGKFGEAINVYERLSGIIRQAASATKEFEKAQQGVSGTVSHTNSHLQNQSQILSDLKTMAMQYLSVWGAQSFINNIIELGGQLEQQRLSIGAILQDTAQANHLFSQIKDLAIKSPFGVQQLDAMTKQLSAYGFQYSELYDWTKRLADISAATGTSVDRLALALGHVRSEGALSGYTLRQFSMGNIPLLQKLSENLGKTKQEIRKMTRNKEIGYEDVLNVLKQLTDEGGMFFEAQETMSQALNAKFKNLRDSFQIMYSEMAEGAPGDFLKGLATTLTDLSRQWQILMPMVGAAGAMWAMNKASAALVNVELAKMATLTNANTLASSKYSVAQLRQIANWEKMPHAMVRARLALQGFKTSLLSLGKMVFSWPTAIFAAIEALTYMWAKQSRESEKAKEMTEVLTNTALESQKNLAKQLSNIDPYEKGMSDSAMKTGIDSMTESIKNYGVNAQAVLEKVYGKDAEGRVMSLAEKYQYLREELEKTEKVYKEMQRTSGGIEFGVEFTDGGWLDDDVQSDLTNYAEAVKEYEDAFVTMTANYATAVNNALEQVKKASPEFKRIADGLSSDAERVKWLYENQGEYGGIYNMFKGALHREDPNAGGGVLGTQLGDNLRSAEQEAMKELDQFLKGTEEWFKKFGYDFTENGKNLSEVQVGNLLRQSKEWLEKHPEWQNIYDVIWDKLNKRWGLPIVPDVTEVEEELPQWLVDFQKELDKTGIKLTANMSMEQIVDEMKKAYDKAQTTINKLGPIAMQAKIDIKGLTDEYIENYKFLNPELYETLKELKKAQDSQSQVTTAAEKRGLQLKGMKKDGTHKAEKQNQEAAKAVREQVRVIKEAADAFQYWREKVGDKGAWEHVQQEFGDVLAKIGITATNIEDVRGQLKKIHQMKEYKAITDKKVKTEIDKEISKDNDQFIRKDFERDTERFLSKTQIELDNLTRSWETFNSVREATGNVKLAIELSGAAYAEGKTRNLADALKGKIQKDLDSIKEGLKLELNVNLSDEQIQREVERAFQSMKPVQQKGESNEAYKARLTEYESHIKGIVDEYKKWRNLQMDVYQKDIQNYAKVLGGMKDYYTQLQLINNEYDQIIESLDHLLQNGDISVAQYTQAQQAAEAKRNSQAWHLEGAYGNLYANYMGMAQEAFIAAYNKEIEDLNNLFDTGAIDAKEYADKINKLNEMQSEFNTQGFLGIKGGVGAFLSGGWQGLMGYYQQRMNEASLRMADARQKYGINSMQYQDAEKEYQYNKDKYESMEKQKKAAESLVFAFQQLANGADVLGGLFKNMGWEGGANAMSDASGLLNGALSGASSLSALGPWGMAAGAGLGLVSSIFALYDKQIQRQIDALKENVDALQENTDSIKTARNRTLGYDTGELRKRMAQQYNELATQLKHIDVGWNEFDVEIPDLSQIAMRNYYEKNSNISGYQAELENLKEQRKDYLEMYNLEKEKKDESKEALMEYKKKIADLDDQILFFVEDLTKELWGIDFESWASQIGDALWTAFENGEDAIEAFHDTAKDIIADVAKRMMNIGLLEPAMKNLETALFGEIGANGQRTGGTAYNAATGQFNEEETLRILGQFFGEDGEFAKVIDSAESFYKMAERATGFDFTSEDSSKTTSGGIKSITEQTADLLASYLNAVRASTSNIENLSAQYFPMYYNALTSSNASLRNLEEQARLTAQNTDAIKKNTAEVVSLFNGLKNKAWKVPMA